ncbi:3'(2'),5'-bisphosphate nucleotidase CysQ [Marinovum sp. 2_MG-2023]|uniref:inositol monophosphatase family protein n=1 Tax=Roseobacteraceae TaxID=2854170 RepID=UPI001FD5584D|nr:MULTISPECIES: 3'(2'),5'-bisphosphate nucleotidase CysQ [Roseobacteraceae]MCJ7872596.1 3'(2'),5'-bisphosphate nucleotidase CysQ [Phaeobacter sp. J2-8]MDO6730282.1 3'(2'),5'-bisphosphate nucleotidase CysQ [Marinovum sp. 2_MG-2023]MDO6779020.1 3'(2'),5'-bisphosphate nucleotidase CysQ [Marinovum sp. 1_MG-2023]
MPGPERQETDLALLLRAARAAGEVALTFTGPEARVWDKPGLGPVTEADFAVNDVLHDILRSARPGYGWLSEETPDDKSRLNCDDVFIIDPIDGTRSFIEGSGTWAHSIAIAHHGKVTAAVIHLPARDRIFAAEQGGGATLNGSPIHTGQRSALTGAHMMAPKPNFEPRHWKVAPPEVRRAFRPSLAYRMALIAQGRFDAMLTLRATWHWDIAAGTLIAEEAGAKATAADGSELVFNTDTPQSPGVLTANPTLHAAVRAELA